MRKDDRRQAGKHDRKQEAAEQQQHQCNQHRLPDIMQQTGFRVIHDKIKASLETNEGQQRVDQDINDLDAHERGDDTADAEDQHIACQQLA